MKWRFLSTRKNIFTTIIKASCGSVSSSIGHKHVPRSCFSSLNLLRNSFHSFGKQQHKVLPPSNLIRIQRLSTETQENRLLRHLASRIKIGGPITIADYMREVLTNSHSGYYMHKDVFGTEGDFTTSPEISQMFGEMLGVWIVNEWLNHYEGQSLQIVELGPGRGTLADDMLRVFSQFPAIKNKVNLHLVEVSPMLGSMQAAKLSGKDASNFSYDIPQDREPGAYTTCKSKYGQDVFWYQSLNDVPKGLSCFIAHEFLDALPVHKFQKTENGWREILVDIDNKNNENLRLVVAPAETAASVAYLKPILSSTENREHIEVSPGAALIVQTITNRIKEAGGFSLIADYGHSGDKTDTFRAFKNHQLHNPLVDPGTADLTADVDFSYLQRFTDDQVNVFGPITQEKYLINMGIGYRLQALLQKAKQEDWPSLISGFKMLTSPDQMGERFKFLAVLSKSKSRTNYTPAGFVDLNVENNESQS